MPSVLRVGRFRFFFYNNEGNKPPHNHVRSVDQQAKSWLDPMELDWNSGFNVREMTQLEQLVKYYHVDLIGAWHDHFDES